MNFTIREIHKFIKNNETRILISFVCVLIISSLVLYICYFSYGFSDDSNDWGNFGSYIGGIGGLCTSLLAIYITCKISIITTKTERIDKVMAEIIMQVNSLDSIIKETRVFESALKKYNSNPSIVILANGGMTKGDLEGKIKNLMSRLLAENFVILRNLNLCFNRYGFQYSGKENLCNQIKNARDINAMGNIYNELNKFIDFYCNKEVTI